MHNVIAIAIGPIGILLSRVLNRALYKVIILPCGCPVVALWLPTAGRYGDGDGDGDGEGESEGESMILPLLLMPSWALAIAHRLPIACVSIAYRHGPGPGPRAQKLRPGPCR